MEHTTARSRSPKRQHSQPAALSPSPPKSPRFLGPTDRSNWGRHWSLSIPYDVFSAAILPMLSTRDQFKSIACTCRAFQLSLQRLQHLTVAPCMLAMNTAPLLARLLRQCTSLHIPCRSFPMQIMQSRRAGSGLQSLRISCLHSSSIEQCHGCTIDIELLTNHFLAGSLSTLRGLSLERSNITTTTSSSDDGDGIRALGAMLQTLHSLTSLNLSRSMRSETDGVLLSESMGKWSFKKLVALDLSHCHLTCPPPHAALPSLRRLNLSGNGDMGDPSTIILDHEKLWELVCDGCVFTANLLSSCLTEASWDRHELYSLSLEGCLGLTDLHMEALTRLPRLRRLNIAHVPTLTDASLDSIARNCTRLLHLIATSTNRLERGSASLEVFLQRLQTLSMGLAPLSYIWPHLTRLSIVRQRNLPRALTIRAPCLIRLNLSNNRLTDAHLSSIRLPSLTHLRVSACPLLCGTTLPLLIRACSAPGLQALDIAITPITNNALNEILIAAAPHMLDLNISLCTAINDDGITRIPAAVPTLTKLAFGNRALISAQLDLDVLVSALPALTVLDLFQHECSAGLKARIPSRLTLTLHQVVRANLTDGILKRVVGPGRIVSIGPDIQDVALQ